MIKIKLRPSIILVKDGSILLMKYMYDGTEVWGIPGGGINENETVLDALKRELDEELGVAIKIDNPVCLVETPSAGKVEHTLHCVFKGSVSKGVPEINPSETTALDIRWIETNNLENRVLYPPINDIATRINEDKTGCPYLGLRSRPWL